MEFTVSSLSLDELIGLEAIQGAATASKVSHSFFNLSIATVPRYDMALYFAADRSGLIGFPLLVQYLLISSQSPRREVGTKLIKHLGLPWEGARDD